MALRNMEKNDLKPMDSKMAPMPKKAGKRSAATFILVILLLAALGAAAYLGNQVRILKANPEKQAQEEASKLVVVVGKLILLPEGETPTVATVNDPEKLKEQPFFANAMAGDKVLIYTNAKKAILYRPSTNKIVEVAPLNIGAAAPAPTTTTTTKTETKTVEPTTNTNVNVNTNTNQ